MKNNKRSPLIGAVIILVAVALIYAVGSRLNINVTNDEAMNIAAEHVGGGTAATAELDWELWRWLWYVEVWHEGLVHEIYIHPNTGEIVSHEIDRQ